MKVSFLGAVLIAAGACGAPEAPVPAWPPASIDHACGPWQAVALDEVVGPRGLTARQAFAAIAGRHLLEGPSTTGNPDDRGELTVDVGPPEGPGRVLLSRSDDPGAAPGSCGARMELAARAYTPDGAIDVSFDRATLWLAPGDASMTAALSAATPDLPEPYQAPEPLTLDVGMGIIVEPARLVEVKAELSRTFNHDRVWVWTAATP